MLRVAAIQLDSQGDVEKNLQAIARLTTQAARQGAQFVALPENALYIGPDLQRVFATTGPELQQLGALAKSLNIWLLVGSKQEPGPRPQTKYNTSMLFNPRGTIAARYRKLHLFRCRLPCGTRLSERKTVCGDEPITTRIGPFTAGLTICYDLRFPELYGHLSQRGATLLCVPANFVAHTGQAHWHVLLRARAIENQAYVIAPGQCGKKYNMDSFGHSLIVDPWGKILAEGSPAKPGIIYADLDPTLPRTLRTHLPSVADRHARWRVKLT